MPWALRMSVYAATILAIIILYFSFRYLKSIKRAKLPYPVFFNCVLIVSIGLFLTYPVWGWFQYHFTGTFNRMEYPDIFIYLFWYGFAYMGTMLNWLLLHDFLLPISKWMSKRSENEVKTLYARLFLTLSAFTLLFTVAKMGWDTNRIVTENITYTLPGTDDFTPLTIVHIADLHADKFTGEKKLAQYISKINEQNPDIVLFGGDLITSGSEYVSLGANALGNIQSTYGTFAVLGDHDFWSDTDYIISELENNGISVLLNRTHRIQHNHSQVKITGVTELYSKQIQPVTLDSLLQDSQDEKLNILFSHQASMLLVERALDTGVHQIYGAHTHGGQIRIPLFFYPMTAARAETPYVNGNWTLGNMLLNVNNGLGFTLSPVRYYAPAQVSVITVTAE